MKVHFYILLFCLSLFIAIPKSQASTNDTGVAFEDLLNLPIEELTMVTVSSKKEEQISNAPSVVSVVTAEEIRRYGANSLMDVLRRMPNVFPASAYEFRNTVASVRGQFSGSINKHLLILLNGRPMRDSFAGGLNNNIYSWFPVDAIEQIELIRGPGSVLYGSNAFAGVLNIRTKQPGDELKTKASVGYGTFDSKRGELTTSGSYGDLKFFASGQISDSDGFDYDAFGTDSVWGEGDNSSNSYAATGQLYYKDLTLNVFDSYSKTRLLTPGATFPMIAAQMRRKFADIGYVHNINQNWDAHFHATYGNTGVVTKERVLDAAAHSLLSEAYVQGEITHIIDLLAGLSYEDLRGSTKANSFTPESVEYRHIWKSAYFQFDVKPWHFLKLTGGAQFNDANGRYNVSPRGAAIINFNQNWGAKILYGEAFRSPTGFETHSTLFGVATGNENIKPELIKTTDLQVFYNSDALSAALTYYKSKQEDSIRFGFVPALGLSQFDNNGSLDFHGVEFEAKARIDNHWSMEGSLSMQENETGAGIKDTQLVPNFMAKLGVTYESGNGITVGVFDSYLDDPTRQQDLNDSTLTLNPKEKSYHHLTANVEFDIPALLQRHDLLDMKFSIFGDNLLENDTVFFPDHTEDRINTLPLTAGRSVFARFTVEF